MPYAAPGCGFVAQWRPKNNSRAREPKPQLRVVGVKRADPPVQVEDLMGGLR
jgi:hypothetical protein